METYKEYPIRCKTCNEQLACFADDYEGLLDTGLTPEEALNELGITDYCSRISMMAPTIVAFNMENREVIEGFKSVDAANEIDAQNESTSRPVFNPCMGVQTGLPQPGLTRSSLLQTGLPKPETLQTRVQPNVPGPLIQPTLQPLTVTRTHLNVQTLSQPAIQTLTQPAIQPFTVTRTQPNVPTLAQSGIQQLSQPGIQALTQLQQRTTPINIQTLTQPQQRTDIPTIVPTVRTNMPTLGLVATARPLQTRTFLPQQIVAPIKPFEDTPQGLAPILDSPTIVPPILPPELTDDVEALGVGIPVKDIKDVGPDIFKDPVVVGVPTINTNPTNPMPTVYVGSGKYVQVLNGRTYLAQ